MWLLKLPCVASASSPCHACNMDASICVTVVLPLLPVTAINGKSNCARQARASVCKACNVSSTSTPDKPACAKPWVAMAACTPSAGKCARKSCASNRSPCKATNKSCACTLRLSVCTLAISKLPSPTKRLPGSHCCICCKLRFMTAPGFAMPARRGLHLKTAVSGL